MGQPNPAIDARMDATAILHSQVHKFDPSEREVLAAARECMERRAWAELRKCLDWLMTRDERENQENARALEALINLNRMLT